MEKEIILSTGDIKMDYEIVDIIYTYYQHKLGFTPGESEIMNSIAMLNSELKKEAVAKGCDALIWINYNIDALLQSNLTRGSFFNLVAYGTGVKIKQESKKESEQKPKLVY
jgi:hypothetical protein